MTDLAARLTKRLADANKNVNLVFSPLSIYAVLALLAAGAGGATLEEVLRVLGARSRRELENSVALLREGPLRDMSESGGPSVAFAYGAWSDLTRPIKPAYRDDVVGTYKAEASVVDFLNEPEQATRQINTWVAEATRNLITSVVPPRSLEPNTRLVLASAVYFKGKWNLAFDERQTTNKPFYRLDGTAVNVPFMTNYSRHYIAEHDGFMVLKLRYKSSSCTRLHHCMCIFLPDSLDGLGSLLDKITSSPDFLREHLPQSTVRVGQFQVPKFKHSFHRSVTAVLNDLGLRLPFTPEADLSDMLEEGGSDLPLLVHDVFQKAVFIIEEESHTVIFEGHVVDPSSGAGVAIPFPAPFQEYTTTKRNCDEATDVYGSSFRAYNPLQIDFVPRALKDFRFVYMKLLLPEIDYLFSA
ncbi:putative serpin-Z8 [Lolium rigidum]|uniref:putative serpin-Z8 n=1 Tax=Lolium rigidum TaxID=89674 RepID=UPI001F5D7C7C|nr:putative serpin-Z8 [Lolium rigidum]